MKKKYKPVNTPIAGVFINLERSADRRKRFIDSATKQTGSCFGNSTEKERKTSQIERIIAVDGNTVTSPIKGVTNNEYACIQSHLKALMYARENKLPCIAIFEDDVLFTDSFEKDFKYYLSVMPDDWHILYLGGSFGRRPSYFDEHFTQHIS